MVWRCWRNIWAVVRPSQEEKVKWLVLHSLLNLIELVSRIWDVSSVLKEDLMKRPAQSVKVFTVTVWTGLLIRHRRTHLNVMMMVIVNGSQSVTCCRSLRRFLLKTLFCHVRTQMNIIQTLKMMMIIWAVVLRIISQQMKMMILHHSSPAQDRWRRTPVAPPVPPLNPHTALLSCCLVHNSLSSWGETLFICKTFSWFHDLRIELLFY